MADHSALRPLQGYLYARIAALEEGDAAALESSIWHLQLFDAAGDLDPEVPLVLHVIAEAARLATAVLPDDPLVFASHLARRCERAVADAVASAAVDPHGRAVPPSGCQEAAGVLVDLLVARLCAEEAMVYLAAERWVDACDEFGVPAASAAATVFLDEAARAAHDLGVSSGFQRYLAG